MHIGYCDVHKIPWLGSGWPGQFLGWTIVSIGQRCTATLKSRVALQSIIVSH